MNILEKYNRQFEYAGLFMTLFIAFRFYRIWQNPVLGDAPEIITLGVLIIFEFIMVHTGMLMSGLPKKVSLYGLIPFYGVFALVFSFAAKDYVILTVYMLVVINRMRFAFSDVPKILKRQVLLKSILAGLAYFLPMFPFIFKANDVPKWGMTKDTLKAIDFPGDSNAAQLLFEMPHVFIAFGLTYYCLLAIIEAFALNPRFGVRLIKFPNK